MSPEKPGTPTDLADACPQCGNVLQPNDTLCPLCGTTFQLVEEGGIPASFTALPEMRYQNTYVWLILASSLDIILTMLVLNFWNSREVNPIASAVIDVMGFGWAIVFKFASILLVIVICEVVGRRDDRVGRTLGIGAVVLNLVAVVYTFGLMALAEPGGQS